MSRRLLVIVFLAACGAGDEPRDPEPTEHPAADVSPPTDDPESATVAVYFNRQDAAPGAPAAVQREVEPGPESEDERRLDAAMRALVAGPTDEERERGFVSFFSDQAGIEVLDTRLSAGGDTASVDFTSFEGRLPGRHGVKSFLPPGVMAELTWTLFESFPELQAVRLSFDGSEESFRRWLGARSAVFTRGDWEQI